LTDDLALEAYTDAAEAYAEADRLKPQDGACLYNWGRVLFILGGFVDGEVDPDAKLDYVTQSIEKFESAVKLQPDNTDALFNLAQSLATRCDLLVSGENAREEGIPLLERAIELFDRVYKLQQEQLNSGTTQTDDEPITPDVLVDTVSAVAECITSLACMQEDMDEAKRLFQEACKRLEDALPLCKERRADILCDWAAVLEAQGNHFQDAEGRVDPSLYEPAIAKLKEAIAEAPDLADPHCDLADLYLNIAHSKLLEATLDNDVAEKDGEDAHQDPQQREQNARAHIAAIESDITKYYEQACAEFKSALELEPDTLDILQRLGDVYFSRWRLPLDSSQAIGEQLLAEARECYVKGLSIEPKDMHLIIRLAQVYHVQGKAHKCRELVEEWHELGGTIDALHEDEDVFEPEFIDKVAEILKQSS
jgi:tetratricopeptide (TPR) repeat protein